MKAAHYGEPPEHFGSYELINLRDEILPGLFVSSHNRHVTEEVTQSNNTEYSYRTTPCKLRVTPWFRKT